MSFVTGKSFVVRWPDASTSRSIDRKCNLTLAADPNAGRTVQEKHKQIVELVKKAATTSPIHGWFGIEKGDRVTHRDNIHTAIMGRKRISRGSSPG